MDREKTNKQNSKISKISNFLNKFISHTRHTRKLPYSQTHTKTLMNEMMKRKTD